MVVFFKSKVLSVVEVVVIIVIFDGGFRVIVIKGVGVYLGERFFYFFFSNVRIVVFSLVEVVVVSDFVVVCNGLVEGIE